MTNKISSNEDNSGSVFDLWHKLKVSMVLQYMPQTIELKCSIFLHILQ